MDPAAFCKQARVLIVAGKGGVGKTTVTAAVATMAARAGLRTLIVEIEGKSGLPAMFGRRQPLDYAEVELAPAGPDRAEVLARTLTPDDALLDYLVDHGLKRVSKRLVSSGALDVVATAVPGLRDILVLGKVKSLEKSAAADLIVLDAPAAGHAVTFLTSAKGLLDAFRVGPIRTQAQEVVSLLSDSRRSQVLLVTLPEETPVNEVVETAYKLEDLVGISLTPLVVNGVYPRVEGLAEAVESATGGSGAGTGGSEARTGPEPAKDGSADGDDDPGVAAGRFRLARERLQADQIERLAEALPLPQLRLPYLFTTEIGPAEVEQLAEALRVAIEALPEPVVEAARTGT
ncbi:MAG TPA: ArsA-related P-loop ATPase [Acidimicrobiales bacterium]|nr:ArsA-related P-loop ATPase [Acidimicrobiales bacterium]